MCQNKSLLDVVVDVDVDVVGKLKLIQNPLCQNATATSSHKRDNITGAERISLLDVVGKLKLIQNPLWHNATAMHGHWSHCLSKRDKMICAKRMQLFLLALRMRLGGLSFIQLII